MVDQHEYHQLVTELPRVATGTRSGEQVHVPLNAVMSPRVRFVQTEVTGVNPAGRALLTDAGPLPYTYLVLALGGRPNDFAIPGVACIGILHRCCKIILHSGRRGRHRRRRCSHEGTDLLLAAARAAGVRRIVAQSYACHRYARTGGPVKTEDDPLDPDPPAAMRQAIAAMAHLDQAVTAAGGIALRYGNFYGDPNDGLVAAVRARKFPIVGDGAGVWSHIHLEDAAAATILALEHDGPAIYNIVDDEPAPTGVWLPELAKILGAPPPQHYPRLLARLFAGEAPVVMATESRGASNAKAKRELGWTLRYPSWRQGFVAAYGQPTPPKARG